jgi:Hypervirulence associated proteins TUDOR domain
MTEEFKKGDRVEWKTSQGETTGKVKQKLTEPTEIKKHHVAASEENPQYLVESDKTGKEAAHKPEALLHVDDN